jgi:nitrate/TMAO reductase-like tetraheme cytochrome c subunit
MLVPFVIAIIALAILTNIYLISRPASLRERSGKILAFLGIFLLPLLAVAFGTQEHMEKSKQTDFCLSCHAMDNYGKSLYVDDEEFIPASHFQNNRVPRDQACYTCHTGYTMYGGIEAKLRGIRHVLVQYLGTVPDTISLYSPYSNAQCLHCHEGSRSFEENEVHSTPAAFRDSLGTNLFSCVSSGCHDVVHNVHELADYDMWDPNRVAEPEDDAMDEEMMDDEMMDGSEDAETGGDAMDSEDMDATDTESDGGTDGE